MSSLPQSLCVLLADSLDYAGAFPPASLPLEAALRNYLAYRTSEDAWMLGRFVCPAARLEELRSLRALWPEAAPLRLAVVGQAGQTHDDFLAGFEADIEHVEKSLERRGAQVRVESYETRLHPAVFATNRVPLETFLANVRQRLGGGNAAPLSVFLEPPLTPDLTTTTEAAIAAFATHGDHDLRFGLKMRLGGESAAAFPAADLVARLIVACREAGCVGKATAGLHHPLGCRDEELGAWRFGFVNLFAAAVLADVHGFPPSQVEAILQDAEAANFHFTEDAFAWRQLSASKEQIAAARNTSLISFGSCSFDEPVAGLHTWLRRNAHETDRAKG